MTGCVGVCRLEPIADVIDAHGEKTTYVKLDAEKARRIVAEHLVNGKPVMEYTIGEAEKTDRVNRRKMDWRFLK